MNEYKTYLENIIEMTCGFKPNVRVDEITPGTMQAFLEGTQEEQALMMGKEGRTIAAITRLSIIFGKRHNFYTYIYVRRRDKIDEALDRTVIQNIFES